MELKFVTQADITDKQIGISYSYYCPAKGFDNHLEHIKAVCKEHQVSFDEFSLAVSKLRVYDPNICCSKCNQWFRLDASDFGSSTADFKYICCDCYAFIHSTVDE